MPVYTNMSLDDFKGYSFACKHAGHKFKNDDRWLHDEYHYHTCEHAESGCCYYSPNCEYFEMMETEVIR